MVLSVPVAPSKSTCIASNSTVVDDPPSAPSWSPDDTLFPKVEITDATTMDAPRRHAVPVFI